MSKSCDPMDGSPTGSLCPWDSPGENTWVGSHFFHFVLFLISICFLPCAYLTICPFCMILEVSVKSWGQNIYRYIRRHRILYIKEKCVFGFFFLRLGTESLKIEEGRGNQGMHQSFSDMQRFKLWIYHDHQDSWWPRAVELARGIRNWKS